MSDPGRELTGEPREAVRQLVKKFHLAHERSEIDYVTDLIADVIAEARARDNPAWNAVERQLRKPIDAQDFRDGLFVPPGDARAPTA